VADRRLSQQPGAGARAVNPSLGRADGCWTIRDGDRVAGGSIYHLTERTGRTPHRRAGARRRLDRFHRRIPVAPTSRPSHLGPLDALARDVRIEVQPDEALACWDSAMIFASLGHDGLDRSRGEAWA
jgi:methionyl-tRNA formyltransferase